MKILLGELKSLSDPIRLRIINLLYSGELCVCKIVQVLSLPQSTVSRHLTILKNAGLVDDTKKGQWSYYKLTAKNNYIKLLLEEELKKDDLFINDINALRRIHR